MQSFAGPLAIKALGFAPMAAAALPALSYAATRYTSIGASIGFSNEFTTFSNASKNPFPQVITKSCFLSLLPKTRRPNPKININPSCSLASLYSFNSSSAPLPLKHRLPPPPPRQPVLALPPLLPLHQVW